MRYLRKETVFMTYSEVGAQIIIPNCFRRISGYFDKTGQMVYVTARSDSIVIASVTDNIGIVHFNKYGTASAIDITAALKERCTLSIPQNFSKG